MAQYISRGTEIDTTKCIENVGGNRFNLVLIASARAREISQQNRHSEKVEHLHTPVTALLEIQNGELGYNEGIRKVRFKDSPKQW
jgi:DNA-directed RNA polymerase subunit K/omega